MDRTNETNENETENQCLNGQDQRNQRNQCLSIIYCILYAIDCILHIMWDTDIYNI